MHEDMSEKIIAKEIKPFLFSLRPFILTYRSICSEAKAYLILRYHSAYHGRAGKES
tara:strand:- start:1568 stop:1735 length:168 start_codon:yes stop_codon:yes gene_type:complete